MLVLQLYCEPCKDFEWWAPEHFTKTVLSLSQWVICVDQALYAGLHLNHFVYIYTRNGSCIYISLYVLTQRDVGPDGKVRPVYLK